MRNKHLIDVFDDVLINGGIFKALSLLDVPWNDDIDDIPLDFEYYGNISGQKIISPLVRRLLGDNEKLTAENIASLSNVLFSMFGRNWSEQYATLLYEYNPISNYDMTETETSSGNTSDTTTHTGTQRIDHTGTVRDAYTSQIGGSETQTATGQGTGTTGNSVYGFNSDSAVDDTYSENTSNNTTTANGQTSTEEESTNNRTDNLEDLRTDNLTDTGTGTHSDTRTLTRSGNIGVTTSQQMIQSQRDLWVWNFIYNVVFPDVDKVLTISTYSNR